MKKPELLVPAGSLETLRTAVIFGADAVYVGGGEYSLRAKSKSFGPEEMREGISFAHERGVKVYAAVNIIAHNDDLEGAEAYLRELCEIGPDALIIADPAIFMTAKRVCPGIDIHISTQANNTNYGTFNFWHQLGAKRVVAGRELSLKEIKTIRDNTPPDLEIEAFVHGAMCISYSGRCLLSNYMTGRDANRGDCTHPCRWKYALVEETRPGEYMPVFENERGTYIMNSRDLCMVDHIPELVECGISSFKIEGRMKTALYVAAAARTYRKAIDDYFRSPELYHENLEWYRQQIRACTYRRFTTGFFFGKPSASDQICDSSTYIRPYVYLGIVEEVREDGLCRITQRNKFSVGEEIEIMKSSGENIPARVIRIEDEEGNAVCSAPHPKQVLYVELAQPDGRDNKEKDLYKHKNSGICGGISGTIKSGDDSGADALRSTYFGGRIYTAPQVYDILRRKEEG